MKLTRHVVFAVYGIPAPKGSLRYVGKGHKPLEDNPNTPTWLAVVAHHAHKATRDLAEPITEPVVVDITVTLARPATVKPLDRPWPSKQSAGHGDVDKLARCILDALQQAQVLLNDALVVELTVRKTYPDTPGVPDRLDRPGAVVRILPATIGGDL